MTKRKPQLLRLKDWLVNGFKEAFEPALSGAWDGGAGTQQRKDRKARAGAVEIAAQDLAQRHGYSYGQLTDGTIVLEPPLNPDCCDSCRAAVLRR